MTFWIWPGQSCTKGVDFVKRRKTISLGFILRGIAQGRGEPLTSATTIHTSHSALRRHLVVFVPPKRYFEAGATVWETFEIDTPPQKTRR